MKLQLFWLDVQNQTNTKPNPQNLQLDSHTSGFNASCSTLDLTASRWVMGVLVVVIHPASPNQKKGEQHGGNEKCWKKSAFEPWDKITNYCWRVVEWMKFVKPLYRIYRTPITGEHKLTTSNKCFKHPRTTVLLSPVSTWIFLLKLSVTWGFSTPPFRKAPPYIGQDFFADVQDSDM